MFSYSIDSELVYTNTGADSMDEPNIIVALSVGNIPIKFPQPSIFISLDLDYLEVTTDEEIFAVDFESGS